MTPNEIAESVIEDFAYELMDGDDDVVGRVAETNAQPFHLDTYDLLDAQADASGDVDFHVVIHLAGEQDTDHAFCGDKITADIKGRIGLVSAGKYAVEDYEVLSVEIDDDGDDEDYGDA